MNKIFSFFSRHRDAIFASLAVNLIVLSVFSGIIFLNKGAVFNYFARKSVEEASRRVENGGGYAESPLTDEAQVTAAVRKANPAVVSIIVSKDVPILEQYYENVNPFPNLPNDFFGFGGSPFTFQIPQYREKGKQNKEIGGGSGFLVSSDGLLITNNHVVSDKDASYTVLANDGKKYPAKVIARDPVIDIAVLKIAGSGFQYLSFGDSDRLKLGQTVIAIGNALGEFRNSVSVGVVSGLSRSITAGDAFSGKAESLDQIIQTDAAINPGNSGGPLLDLGGNVIGVNVAVVAGSENIGFALPGNAIRAVVNSVKQYGQIVRPYIGIRYVSVTEALKEKNNLTVDYGVLVSKGETKDELAVSPGSPADKAGIVENDIILQIDGEKLDSDTSLASIIRKKNVGDTIKLKILSKGSEKETALTLEKFPENGK